jgi:hypothetical protein
MVVDGKDETVTMSGGEGKLNIRTTFGGMLTIDDDGVSLVIDYAPPVKTPDGDYQPSPEAHTVLTIRPPNVK